MALQDTRVLIVHGHPRLRQQIRDSLSSGGCELMVLSATGNDAVDRLQEGPYDLLISAVTLPDLQGWGLVKMVRSGTFCNPDLPMIVIHEEEDGSLVDAQAREHAAITLSAAALRRLPRLVEAVLGGRIKPEVLVIEDDAKMALFIAESLMDLYRIDVAGDGTTGLQLWESKRHALVVLDIMLPEVSGGEVLEHILAMDSTQPVVILTGYGSTERHKHMMLRGASAFLAKPVDVQTLRSTCESTLRHRVYSDLNAQLQSARGIVAELSSHVEAADTYLTSGRAALAQYELKGAIGALSAEPASLDRRGSTAREGDNE